ncbi:hypothetical protein O7621_23770 [Solwaraspora sp. WMMD937]|nr:hypothetical protein [Solwaraspora sp. WMMD937]WFE20858.1 hypothetical protein O7621_23770 [Solwaraspora sp. WMMD937]
MALELTTLLRDEVADSDDPVVRLSPSIRPTPADSSGSASPGCW